ncbi:hypothetical protein [Flagellimonas onchidii]|uniref:hypothetical protein n=1 Tax=Flagellimonas onchidii TaxID=2562684 RepID=UPI0010A5EE0A|nr:hypothetical protein [Allomuricauda onchidii]
MHKQLVILSSILLLFESCEAVISATNKPLTNIQKYTIYKDEKPVAQIPPYKATIPCDTCYIYKKIQILEEPLILIIPIEIVGGRWEQMLNVKEKEDAPGVLIFTRWATFYNEQLVYFKKNANNQLQIVKSISLQSEDYRKRLAENDYEHVPAIRVCLENKKVFKISDTLNTMKHPVFTQSYPTCNYCLLESKDYNACLENYLK